MPLKIDAEREAGRVLAALANLIESLGLDARDIEHRLDWVPGTLTALLTRRLHLRFQDVIEVLFACGVPPAVFFVGVYADGATEAAEHRAPDGPDRPLAGDPA